MKNLYLNLVVAAVACLSSLSAVAGVVTTSPVMVQTDSKGIIITFHADQGNRGLVDLPASDAVYVHTGLITTSSESASDWQYASQWGDNDAKYLMTRTAQNTYKLTIGDLSTFYGISASQLGTVTKLAFVFRNANSTREGKSDTGGDVFVDVFPPGLNIEIITDPARSVVDDKASVSITVNTTEAADIKLFVNSTASAPLASAFATTTLSKNHTFAPAGDYELIATAIADGKTVQTTLSVVSMGMPFAREYPGGIPIQGAVRNETTGDVTFCIAAPDKTSVVLIGSWNNYRISSGGQMNYQDYKGTRYFWTIVPNLVAGKDYMYYYLVDGDRRVGDPYARLVLDPFNDRYIPSSVYPDMPVYPSDKVEDVPLAVYNSTRDVYDWQVRDFKGVDQSDLVIYELLIRDFTGTEGQAYGSGTVRGVIEKLDYLKDLGVNAIELLPIMEFDGNISWGYNTNFYFAPDKAYGNPDDYRELIDGAHARGMAVILDIVFNQSAGLHPWFQMYDIAANPFYNGSAPHAYSVLNDWNQDNPLVEQQWTDALRYWMTAYKVDGFRFDLVKGLGNNDSYGNTYDAANNTWGPPSDSNTNAYNKTRVERMARLHKAMMDVNPNAYFINENLAGAQEENQMADDGEINWANVNTESVAYAKGISANSGLNRFYAPSDSRIWGSTVSYAESHDEERMAYAILKNGVSGVKGNTAVSMRRLGSVAAQMLMAPGAHMIWQFQEFGADQTTKNQDGSNNTDSKKVIWSYLNNPYRAGLRQTYKELNFIRSANSSMFKQGVTTTVQCAATNWNSGRYINLVNGASQIVCVINPLPTSQARVSVPLIAAPSSYRVLSASYGTTPKIMAGTVTLPAGAYAVFGTSDMVNVDNITADGTLVATARLDNDNRIIVDGDYTTLEVYSIDGRPCNPASPLRSGVYVVNLDGQTTKLLVR